ncbi:MAG: hemerythrin domain-containing protein [Cyclobacteriaceae bacterium]|jgi:iron-sulfur cluster repair protein YtfE (RIC family)|nr:hemerythrin domain-containing protein [Cyclobacteriaceae bacterium]
MPEPIKRHINLQPLSRDHHFGLLLCFKIREGFRRKVEPERIKRYADWFWQHHLVPHFITEEKHVFPILGNDHPLVGQALAEHRQLQQLFEKQEDVSATLSQIEEALDAHIRFEERVLFNEIQKIAAPEQLAECEKHHHGPFEGEPWPDEFWMG